MVYVEYIVVDRRWPTEVLLVLRQHLACPTRDQSNLGYLGTIITGHLLTAYPAYPYLGLDGAAALSLFTHHAWIGGFFIVGSGAHAALFLVADYRAWSLPGLERVLAHRHSWTGYPSPWD
jgi:hypothetical protein